MQSLVAAVVFCCRRKPIQCFYQQHISCSSKKGLAQSVGRATQTLHGQQGAALLPPCRRMLPFNESRSTQLYSIMYCWDSAPKFKIGGQGYLVLQQQVLSVRYCELGQEMGDCWLWGHQAV